MARDRKRAKQRRDRGAAPARGRALSQPVRTEVPGSLDHASGEADEFEAAIVRGADGVEAEPDALAATEPDGSVEDGSADIAQEPSSAPARRAGAAPAGAPLRGGNRAVGFLRASWAELQRVQWPDRRQVSQATAVVVGFVAIAGLYLGLADLVAKEVVEAIL